MNTYNDDSFIDEVIYDEVEQTNPLNDNHGNITQFNRGINFGQAATDSTSIDGTVNDRIRLTNNGQRNETNNHEQGHLAELNCEFIIQKIRKRKWWILLIIVLVLIVGLAVGLSVSSPPTMATSKTTALMVTTVMTVGSTALVTTTTASQEPTEKAVLMLSTSISTNVAMVITLNGEVDYDINFTFGVNTEVHQSCAAALFDRMFVFGGYNQKRQMSEVQDCKLKRIGDLDFNFVAGGCNTFPFGIMLCFADKADKECHSFNGETFKTEPSSKFSHQYVRALGSYRKSPFVTGHYSKTNGLKTEILHYEAGYWYQVDDYPFSNGDRISGYATASTDDSIYIIGGYTNGSPKRSPTIAKYSEGSWTKTGSLKQARSGHGAMTIEGITMIIGGMFNSGLTTNTELWEFESSETKIIKPTLSWEYSNGIALFAVDVGYCRKN